MRCHWGGHAGKTAMAISALALRGKIADSFLIAKHYLRFGRNRIGGLRRFSKRFLIGRMAR
jgi:hypothetical protein